MNKLSLHQRPPESGWIQRKCPKNDYYGDLLVGEDIEEEEETFDLNELSS